MLSKVCPKCGLDKDRSDYSTHAFGIKSAWCRTCHTEYCRSYRANNPEKEAVRARRSKEQRDNAKEQVFSYYVSVCNCCGESEKKFLSVDHTEGKGRQHRATMGTQTINVWLVNNEFPEGFQVLCYNCNCGKRVNNGVCPHQETPL